MWLTVGAFINGLAGMGLIAWIGSLLPDAGHDVGGLDFAALVTAVVWVAVFEQLVVSCFYLASFLLFITHLQYSRRFSYVASLICFGLAAW